MNENTTKLIEKLADKLGTTSEYVWGVLIKQAPITGWTNLCVGAILIAVCLVGLWILVRKCKSGSGDDDATVIFGSFVIILSLVTVVMVGCSVTETINALFNPEYWALKEILGSVKNQ